MGHYDDIIIDMLNKLGPTFERLAQGAQNVKPIYTCPTCGCITNIYYANNAPYCVTCKALVTYHYIESTEDI